MKLNDNEVLVGEHVIEIGEQELGVGLNEPDYIDLTLTVNDGDHEIVITGMDDEMERFAKAILAALKAKQDRQAVKDEEEARQWLPTKTFRLEGYDVWKALGPCDVGDQYKELDDGSIDVMLPDDEKTLAFLRWLADAYCVEWREVPEGHKSDRR